MLRVRTRERDSTDGTQRGTWARFATPSVIGILGVSASAVARTEGHFAVTCVPSCGDSGQTRFVAAETFLLGLVATTSPYGRSRCFVGATAIF